MVQPRRDEVRNLAGRPAARLDALNGQRIVSDLRFGYYVQLPRHSLTHQVSQGGLHGPILAYDARTRDGQSGDAVDTTQLDGVTQNTPVNGTAPIDT
jgi:hypothetical protein